MGEATIAADIEANITCVVDTMAQYAETPDEVTAKSAQLAVLRSEFAVRALRDTDLPLIHGVVKHQAMLNGFFHGVPRETIFRVVGDAVGYWTRSHEWTVDVVTPVDVDLSDEVCGFAIRHGALTWAFAYVKPAYRGRGAFRLLRGAAGLTHGSTVEVILGSPNALRIARQHFQVFYTPFRILETIKETTT